jgi:hypothetical protein
VCAGAAGLRGAIPAAWPLVQGGDGVRRERGGGGVFMGGLGLGEGLGFRGWGRHRMARERQCSGRSHWRR